MNVSYHIEEISGSLGLVTVSKEGVQNGGMRRYMATLFVWYEVAFLSVFFYH
jgi:hypothetical protein